MELEAALATVIDRRRDAAGLSVNDLAVKAGVPRSTMQNVLHGDPSRSHHLVRIAFALDTMPSTLWAEAESRVG